MKAAAATIALVVAITAVLFYYWNSRQPSLDPFGIETFRVSANQDFIKDIYETDLSKATGRAERYITANNEQLMYKELVQMFAALSANQPQQITRVTSKMYQPETIEDPVRDELDQVTKILLDYIKNAKAGYEFAISGYGGIWIYEDERGNRQYDYDVFVQDAANAFSLRLKVDLVKYVDPRDPRSHHTRAAAERAACRAQSHLNEVRDDFVEYDLGLEGSEFAPDQTKPISGPMDVVPTGPDVLNAYITRLPNLPRIYAIYLNGVRIYNSNAIVNPDQYCPLHVVGIGAQPVNIPEVVDGVKPLDYGVLSEYKSELIEKWPQLNRWIRPPDEVASKWAPPPDTQCAPETMNWTLWGLTTDPAEPCEGHRDPSKKRPFTAEFNPTIHGIVNWKGPYDWQHEMDRQNVAAAGPL